MIVYLFAMSLALAPVMDSTKGWNRLAVGKQVLWAQGAEAPDATFLKLFDKNGIILVSMKDNEEINSPRKLDAGGEVVSLGLSPDGKTLAAGIRRIDKARDLGQQGIMKESRLLRIPAEIKLWDLATGKEKFTIEDCPWNGLSFSPDGKTFVSCGGAGVVKVWDSQTGKEKLSLEQERLVTCAAFSPDGKTLATGSFDYTVRLWDLAAGKTMAVLQGHRNTVECVVFSPDGKTLASGGYDEVVRLWDVATKKKTATLEGENAGRNPGDGVFAIAFSPDGKLLASGVNSGVKVWDVAANKLLHTLKGERCESLTFSPDGKMLALAVGSDRVVRLWEVASRKERATFTGHNDSINSIVFSPDGQTLISGGKDGNIFFWDLGAGQKKSR